MGMIMMWRSVPDEQLAEIVALDPDAFFEWLEEDTGDGSVLDLDKDWHGVHGVLTGTAFDTAGPGGRAVLGGAEFGEDHGYGPARALPAVEVAAVADELDAVGAAGFSAALDPELLARLGVYPSGAGWADPDERRYLEASFGHLRAFYRSAADAGRAMVILIV